MTPTTAAVIAASAPDSRRLARSGSMNGAPAKIHSIDGVNVTHVVIAAPRTPTAARTVERRCVAVGREESDKLRYQDQRPGRGPGEAEPIDHFRCSHPMVRLDRLLGHIGQQRIGAAEAHHRELGEEHADRDQHVVGAERQRGQPHRRPPQHNADRRRREELTPAIAVGRRDSLDLVGKAHLRWRGPRHEISDQRRSRDDQRKRQGKEEDADEGEQPTTIARSVFRFSVARLLMRSSASSTITRTAALMP